MICKEKNQTVLLIDNDLKHQRIYQYMGIDSDTGLINYFEKDTPLSDLIIWPGIDKLTLISGGKNITESAELLGSPKMKQLVAEMKGRYADRILFLTCLRSLAVQM